MGATERTLARLANEWDDGMAADSAALGSLMLVFLMTDSARGVVRQRGNLTSKFATPTKKVNSAVFRSRRVLTTVETGASRDVPGSLRINWIIVSAVPIPSWRAASLIAPHATPRLHPRRIC